MINNSELIVDNWLHSESVFTGKVFIIYLNTRVSYQYKTTKCDIMKDIKNLYENYSNHPGGKSVDNKYTQNLLSYPYIRLKHDKKNDNKI